MPTKRPSTGASIKSWILRFTFTAFRETTMSATTPRRNLWPVYRKEYGKDYYSFREGPIYGIVLDSSLFKAPGHVQEEAAKQEQWLERELTQAEAAHAVPVIFQHIPWFLERADEPDQYFNIPLETRRRVLGDAAPSWRALRFRGSLSSKRVWKR